MEIELVGESFPREVEFVEKVICVESKEHDMSWEFQKGLLTIIQNITKLIKI